MSKSTPNKPARQSRLAWVKADDLSVNPVAQREFRPTWAQHLLATFDIDKFQVPHVNKRADGTLNIMEGQHSVWAYRHYFGEGQQVQVWLYDGLTEQEEAEFFLSLNNKRAIDGMAKFKAAVTAGRADECDIDRIVRANGCTVSKNKSDTSIAAVAALTSIYGQHGGVILGKTLRTIAGAFGDGGYEKPVLVGIAMVLARYPEIEDERLISKLAAIRNGWKGLVQKTTLLKEAMGATTTDAAAGAVVDFYNSGRGGKKLPSWWREDEAA